MKELLTPLIQKVKEIAEKLGLIADYVVEQRTSGVWTYRKWNSGVAECWVYDSTNFKATHIGTHNGWNIKSTGFKPPSIFVTTPSVTSNVRISTGYSQQGYHLHNADGSIGIITYSSFGGDITSGITVSIHCIGRWK